MLQIARSKPWNDFQKHVEHTLRAFHNFISDYRSWINTETSLKLVEKVLAHMQRGIVQHLGQVESASAPLYQDCCRLEESLTWLIGKLNEMSGTKMHHGEIVVIQSIQAMAITCLGEIGRVCQNATGVGRDEETTGMEGDTDWASVLKYLHHAVYLRDQDAMLCAMITLSHVVDSLPIEVLQRVGVKTFKQFGASNFHVLDCHKDHIAEKIEEKLALSPHWAPTCQVWTTGGGICAPIIQTTLQLCCPSLFFKNLEIMITFVDAQTCAFLTQALR